MRRNDYVCDVLCKKELLCAIRRGHHNDTVLCPEKNSQIRNGLSALIYSSKTNINKGTNESIITLIKPLNNDDFIKITKKAIWNKISGWIIGK